MTCVAATAVFVSICQFMKTLALIDPDINKDQEKHVKQAEIDEYIMSLPMTIRYCFRVTAAINISGGQQAKG